MPCPSCGFECDCHLPRDFAAARGGCVKIPTNYRGVSAVGAGSSMKTKENHLCGFLIEWRWYID